MDRFTERLQAEMVLMKGKEMRFGCNIPGEDKLLLCNEAIESIKKYMKNLEENPSEYAEKEEHPKFQIKVELCKLNDDYFGFKG